jgi:hypothetical protein
MTQRDLVNNVKIVSQILPLVMNNDTEGGSASAGINLKGFDSVIMAALIGDSGDNTGSAGLSIKVVIEDSADDVTYAAVTNADYVLLPTSGNAAAPDGNGVIYTNDGASEDQKTVVVGYVGPKQYVRLRLDFTGTHTNGTPAAIFAVLGNPALLPVSYA